MTQPRSHAERHRFGRVLRMATPETALRW